MMCDRQGGEHGDGGCSSRSEDIRSSMLLYAVTDRSWLQGRRLSEQVAEVLEGGATFLQLREKEMDSEAFLKEADEIKALARRYGVPFVINDNVEVALACDADGVHVGQSDMEAGDVRTKLGPDKILGVSAQTVEQAVKAERQGADYLGVGAVFVTGTKLDADYVPVATLQAVCDAVSIPVIAIGGIDEENLLQLEGTGIAGVAIVSALFSKPDIVGAAKRLKALSQQAVDQRSNQDDDSNQDSDQDSDSQKDRGETIERSRMETAGVEQLADIQGAIFDMDGTLLDSMAIWDTMGETYLRSRGIEPRADIREVLRTMSLRQAAEYFISDYRLEQSVEQIMDGVNESIENFYCQEASLKPGVKDVLEKWKATGVRMCVATATDRHLVEAALGRTGVLSYFTQIFTCNETGAGKDQPDIFREALKALGTKKEKTFVFEDAFFAARTVKEEGIALAVVADPSAEGQWEELKKIADVTIRDWRDIVK